MQIAVIGSGRMGTGLIKSLAPLYPDVVWAGRSPEKIAQKIAELGLSGRVRAADHATGVQAGVIILTLWHRDTPAFVAQHGAALQGKIVVHIANPFNEEHDDFTTAWDTSAAEEFQRMVPGARVVGAFKTTMAATFDHPIFPEGRSDVLVAADDAEAKATVMDLLRPLPFRVLDAGGMINNRTIERMILMGREMALRYGYYPQAGWRLLGEGAR